MTDKAIDNTGLDAAIVAGLNARRASKGLTQFPANRFAISDDDRILYRGMVAKLLEGMDGKDFPPITPRGMVYGYNAALAEIRRVAGIGG
jgi:hypothetical protein